MIRLTLAVACAGCLGTPPPPLCTGDYGAPQLLDVFRTDVPESGPWLSRDRTEILYAHEDPNAKHLYRSRRASPSDPWPPANPIPVSEGDFDDSDPFVTSDGLTLYFTTFRDGHHLYTATRSSGDAEFGDPMPVLGLPDAYAVSLTEDQLDIFYEYAPPAMTTDIYTQHRAHTTDAFVESASVLVTGLGNLTATRRSPSISADGSVLMFGLDPTKMFRTTRLADTVFDTPTQVETNTDADASITDDAAMVFTRHHDGEADLYVAERSCN
jgi:hypothetical protein